ncbi:3-dehydroquinate dehydratase [Dethiosulfatibacter aminovorans DSM 17477]|uniref:3-dehydroquinate dehydratase n=1 Tax=Dethiosulfatibacter aminovorans DSM 17477 TaxID=1121476 RepID=A0A1M6AI12_9FIRM|nr:type I 3-dehydroquinate dehydratase [Dethiosulfatibacter aminovorans]SHI36129.1 3-dehydroquinate dehydratase [Dethiosulfatibacter aminovorans DSM 17477]
MNKSKTVTVKGLRIGGDRTKICLPLVAESDYDLTAQALELKKMKPDLIEWRVDYYEDCGDKDKVLNALSDLKHVIEDIPLIFTLRTVKEGGMAKIEDDLRKEVIELSVESGLVELVDIEMSNDKEFIDDMRSITLANGTKIIMSYHNFDYTPEEVEIRRMLAKGQDLDGDIVKLAIMPKSKGDVITLMNAVHKTGRKLDIPVIAISMGELGQITRIACRIMGTAVTFASGIGSSAPGQLGYKEMKDILYTLEGGRHD